MGGFVGIAEPVAQLGVVGAAGQLVFQRVIIDDGCGAAVVQHVSGFRRALADIHGHGDQAESCCRQQQRGIIGAVGE